ncbi:MAG: peptide chain release factor N(5)-glutamine methyltransferase [Anaerolineales bacterium]
MAERRSTVSAAIQWATGLLASAGVDSPRLDAELLLAHVLGCDRVHLRTRWDTPLAAEALGAYADLVQRRVKREPVAYLLGTRAFYDIELQVTPAVLVPRPETEHLVEEAIRWAQRQGDRSLRVIDVGTGSGAIAIVLARHLPAAHIVAVDLSATALAQARRNAVRLGVEGRIAFVRTDLLLGLASRFDLIVANLPYVDHDELGSLMPEVSRYEPQLALDGGLGGLEVVSRLIAALPQSLAPDGLALFELDPRQAERARVLAQQALPEARIEVILDYAGRARVLAIERASEPTIAARCDCSVEEARCP